MTAVLSLTVAALIALATPTLRANNEIVRVDARRAERHVLEIFADIPRRCPVHVINATHGDKGTEITVVPRCDVGYPIVRFIEARDGNLIALVLERGKFRPLASRF